MDCESSHWHQNPFTWLWNLSGWKALLFFTSCIQFSLTTSVISGVLLYELRGCEFGDHLIPPLGMNARFPDLGTLWYGIQCFFLFSRS